MSVLETMQRGLLNSLIFLSMTMRTHVILVDIPEEIFGTKAVRRYIQEEINDGNFLWTRIAFDTTDKTTSVLIEARVEDDIDDSSFKKTIHESCLLKDKNGGLYVDDINVEETIEHTILSDEEELKLLEDEE